MTDLTSKLITKESEEKAKVVNAAREAMQNLNLSIVEEHVTKPWGAYFRFADSNIDAFIGLFFSDIDITKIEGHTLSPKLLIVAPHQKLSWQYHHRRSELWQVIAGRVGTITSLSDQEEELKTHETGDFIEIRHLMRHRLIGLDCWGYIAEIWQHTDETHPSEEEDIIRLSDDYGREGTTQRS